MIVCAGGTIWLNPFATASEEILNVMWRLAAVDTDVETRVLLYSALIGAYNIGILTVRGWHVP